ncbi:hypothetical protein Vafri_20764 [Volvox africanus]|uniref:Uncharacterized protein n=1 Tax=Volvox africanus TaxID=51714 RepID=A0A8J4BRG0_9CHLO|nr:hypothetical protein Vafri_20764 [Volvox africanus]
MYAASKHASTSRAAALPPAVPHHHRHRPPLRGGVLTFAKRRGDGLDWDDNDPDRLQPGRRSRGSGGFQFSSRRGMYRIQYNDYETEVRQEEAWKLLVPMVGGLVLGAAFIGPLIIGLAFTAVAVGAALSAGALFTSLFLPFFFMIGMGALFFGGLTFSAFATLGTALLLPKLISLAVVAGGLGLGAMAVSLFLKPAANKASDRRSSGARGSNSSGSRQTIDVVPEPGEPETDPEVDRQLREFDELLAGREQQRSRPGGDGGGGAGRR